MCVTHTCVRDTQRDAQNQVEEKVTALSSIFNIQYMSYHWKLPLALRVVEGAAIDENIYGLSQVISQASVSRDVIG